MSVRQASKEAQQRLWLTYYTREIVFLLDEVRCVSNTRALEFESALGRHAKEVKASWRRMDTGEQP